MRRTLVLCTSIAVLLSSCLSTATTPPEAPQRRLSVTGAGGALERVTSEEVSETHPTVSPDGSVLLFEVRVYDAADNLSQQTLVGVNPSTRAQRTLFTSTNSFSNHPVWLPDGSSYVYSSNSPGAWSLVRALTSSPNAAVTVVASGEIAPNASWPSISPDGSRVAFSATFNGVEKVAVIGLDGSRLTILGEGLTPAWNPDGGTLAFTRAVGDKAHLFLVKPTSGTDLVQLTSGEFDHEMPSWSPDGQYLVFATNRGWNKYGAGTEKRIRNLYIVRKDGTGLTQLTDGDAYSASPHWGRDGWIYFASDQSGNLDVWRLQTTGDYAGLRAVTPGSTDWDAPQPAISGAEPSSPEATPAPSGSGCTKDTDCKGDRICQAGKCVSPD